jgi:predicted ester cyclase
VPLDATNQAPLTMDFVHLLENDRATPSADFAYQVLMSLSGSISSGGFYFWDPLSAGIAADPSLTTIQGRPLRVVTEPGTDSGRTVTDGSGTPIDVAATPDNHRFEQALRNVLNGRQVDAPLPESAASAESETQNLLIVRRVFEEGWGEPNIALLRNLLHTEYTLTGNNPAVSQGADGLLNLVIDLHTLLPDLSVEVESMADAGDMVFARVILRGTLSNPDLGALATSAPVVLVLHSLVRIEQGTIREEWHAVDFSPLMQALTP